MLHKKQSVNHQPPKNYANGDIVLLGIDKCVGHASTIYTWMVFYIEHKEGDIHPNVDAETAEL